MIPSSLRDSFSFVKKIQVSYTLQKKIVETCSKSTLSCLTTAKEKCQLFLQHSIFFYRRTLYQLLKAKHGICADKTTVNKFLSKPIFWKSSKREGGNGFPGPTGTGESDNTSVMGHQP